MKIIVFVMTIAFFFPSWSLAWTPVIDHFDWEGGVGQGVAIEVENRHGDVRSRRSRPGFVPVSAVIQRHPDDDAVPKIEIVPGEVLRITVSYPEKEGDGGGKDDAVLSARRVDLAVYAPPGNPLVCRTSSGLIEAKGLKSDVDARAETGDIVVRTDGVIRASTVRGKIFGWFKGLDRFGGSRFETRTGNVKLFVSPRADLSVAVETSGFITSDFSMVVEPVGRIREKKAVVTVGKGGHEIRIKSVLGDIQLVRIIE